MLTRERENGSTSTALFDQLAYVEAAKPVAFPEFPDLFHQLSRVVGLRLGWYQHGNRNAAPCDLNTLALGDSLQQSRKMGLGVEGTDEFTGVLVSTSISTSCCQVSRELPN